MAKQKNEIPQFKEITREEARVALKEDMQRILANINRIMNEKGISRLELSFRINSEKGHTSRMLNTFTKNGLTVNVLGRIHRALEVKMEDLVR